MGLCEDLIRAKLDELMACISSINPYTSLEALTEREPRQALDDFAAAGIASADDLRTLFAERFYFGCEADDVTTAWAFDRHGNHRLSPMLGSDIGHFDVIDMSHVLAEAYELVEDELITADDFREFVFTNVARLHTALNPDFFRGTVVEEAVATHVLQVHHADRAVETARD